MKDFHSDVHLKSQFVMIYEWGILLFVFFITLFPVKSFIWSWVSEHVSLFQRESYELIINRSFEVYSNVII